MGPTEGAGSVEWIRTRAGVLRNSGDLYPVYPPHTCQWPHKPLVGFSFVQDREESYDPSFQGREQPLVTGGQARSHTRSWKQRCVGVTWGMWNVRTFNSQVRVGEDGNLVLEGADPEKPRAFCDTLAAAGIELCCISEVRGKGEGTMRLNDHLIIFSGLLETAPQAQQGVGIVLNERMQQAWAKAGNFVETAGSRLLRIKLVIHKRVVNVISVYAPTYTNEALHKDAFYDSLNSMLGRVKSSEEVFVLGDFNARVRRRESGDTNAWDESLIVGPYGLDHTNDNGERLLALCEGSKAGCLRVMSAFFPHKHYGTWYHNSSSWALSIP